MITGYVGGTQVATVDHAWATNPNATTTFAILAADAAKLDASLQVTAASVQGNVTGSVGSVTGAVGSVTGAVGSVTGNVGGNVVGSVGSVTGNVGGNVTGSVGSVAAGGIAAASFVAGAIDATAIAADAIGSSELAASAVTEIVNGVWDEAIAGHLGAGTTGAKLNSAASAGDPWTTALPGAYDAGTAGKIVGDNLNAKVGDVKTQTDKLAFTVANQVDANVLDWKSAVAPAMTGDAFARLGAPAGASVSADVAAVKTVVDAIKVKTDQLVFTIANKVDASIQAAGDLAQAAADKVWLTAARTLTAFGFTVTVAANNDKTGYTTTAADQQAVADELLNRNIAGGGSGGARIVRDALRALRNRRRIAGGVLTTYQEDDATPAWTAAVTTAVGNPVNEVDPV